VIYHRGERRVRRVLRQVQSLLMFSCCTKKQQFLYTMNLKPYSYKKERKNKLGE